MDPSVRQRFIKLLGMTGSVHDGEALNALRIAQKLAADQTPKLTFLEMVQAVGVNQADLDKLKQEAARAYQNGFSQGMAAATPMNWLDAAERCQDRDDRLTQWEREFLESFLNRGFAVPTERQRAVLERIAYKCSVPVPEDA